MELNINGARRRVEAEPDAPLLEVLRDELGLTGAKYGCGEGQCGACTVLIDGKPTRSCILPVGGLSDKAIETVEGVARGAALHPVQQAFVDADALQCGYCTSGMVVAAVALLRKTPSPTDTQIAQALQGNVCRCGAYPRIVRAVRLAATAQRSGNHE